MGRRMMEPVLLDTYNASASDRFWSKVSKDPDGCWRWTGAVNKATGFGWFTPCGSWLPPMLAPVAAVELTRRAALPRDLTVVPGCGVHQCVNPDHLVERPCGPRPSPHLRRPSNGPVVAFGIVPDRIREKYTEDPETGCWIWTAAHHQLGYGVTFYDGRQQQVHRVLYMVLVGPIPDGLELDHLCRVPACVNPAHLEPVTHAENVRRGISPSAVRARSNECHQGHPLTGDNVYITPKGARSCRTCSRRRDRVRGWRR